MLADSILVLFAPSCVSIFFQLGNEVSTTLQLLYIGIFAFMAAGLVEFLDEKDRFFTPNITKITAYEWAIYIGIACSGTKILYSAINITKLDFHLDFFCNPLVLFK